MIVGVVEGCEAWIRVTVRGPGRKSREVDAVVDTGYTASLTLPPSVIGLLGLRWQGLGRGMLADGSECLFDVYEARVVWDGTARRISVDEADADPLIGMTLLRGYEIRIEVRSRGKVTIERLP